MDISMNLKAHPPSADLQLLEEFGRCRRALSLYFNHALRSQGLGTKQASILRFLAKRGKASLADLSRDTLTDPAAMTKMVNHLLKDDLVRQSEHPTDKRRWELTLSPQGLKLASRVETLYAKRAGEALEILTTSERSAFGSILCKVASNLAGNKISFKTSKKDKSKETP
jgi:DNA-binding MarR family transcriptional regulator